MKSEQRKPIVYKFPFISNGSYKSMNRNMSSLMIRNDSAVRNYYSNQQPQQKNGDQTLPYNIGSFTKGFEHSDIGIVDSNSFLTLTKSLNSKNPIDFDNIILEGQRRLTNPQSGLSYDLEGKDSNSLVTPPPPSFSSDEMAGEIVENYWMALARDINFTNFTDSNLIIKEAIDDLSLRKVFKGPKENNKVTAKTLFRGVTPGDLTGPYISQFFYLPIPCGASKIDSKMKTFKKEKDFMTSFEDWKNIQDGFNSKESIEWDDTLRYIRNGRDLSAWVRMDVLYQAYFNAMLILMTPKSEASQQAGIGCPFNPTNPYRMSTTQEGFTTFGGPHICSLLAEVSNRALKHAWYHKWFVHLKLRPEAFGGAIHLNMTNPNQAGFPISSDLDNSTVFDEVKKKNGGSPSYLLPQAFPEGSPMHPSYPAGHATVAGACVTILKAFFDETFEIPNPVIPSDDGLSLNTYSGNKLTVGNELNKLASNVSFGRNFAGVHYRSDAIESQNMGEEFAISVLRDQKFLYNENFTGWKFTRFNGTICEI